jgi:hypothetical protein
MGMWIYWSKDANEISWSTPTPLGDCLSGVYFRIFLEYFEQKYLKFSWMFKKNSYTIMLWFTSKIYWKYVIVKKIQIHLQVLLLLKNTSYNVFKVFFIHWID